MKTVNSTKELIETIHAEMPGLQEALNRKDHIRATSMLRDFVSDLFIVGGDEFHEIFKCWPAHEIYNLLLSKKIYGLCGAISLFLSKIYNIFGYYATTYNYGVASTGNSHMTTLVKFPEDGKFYVQDASLRTTYAEITEKGAKYIDFSRLLQLIKNEEYEKIIMKRSDNPLIQIARETLSNHVTPPCPLAIDKDFDFGIYHLNRLKSCYISQKIVADYCDKDVSQINNYDFMLMSTDTDIIIWGTGIEGQRQYFYLNLNGSYNILAFTDNDEKKWGGELFGIKVIRPDEVRKYPNIAICIASIYYEEILTQIINENITSGKIIRFSLIKESIQDAVIRKNNVRDAVC